MRLIRARRRSKRCTVTSDGHSSQAGKRQQDRAGGRKTLTVVVNSVQPEDEFGISLPISKLPNPVGVLPWSPFSHVIMELALHVAWCTSRPGPRAAAHTVSTRRACRWHAAR